MAICFITEPQGVNVEMYDRVRADIGMDANPPDGLIVHGAGQGGDGKWRVIEMWDSAAAQQTFARERLGPALQKAGIKPPMVTEVPLHHLTLAKAPAV
jgi:hypothetical protein